MLVGVSQNDWFGLALKLTLLIYLLFWKRLLLQFKLRIAYIGLTFTWVKYIHFFDSCMGKKFFQTCQGILYHMAYLDVF